jgi:hypothetical protein
MLAVPALVQEDAVTNLSILYISMVATAFTGLLGGWLTIRKLGKRPKGKCRRDWQGGVAERGRFEEIA